MSELPIENELVAVFGQLPPAQQRQVLAFTRSLARDLPVGISGDQVLRFAGTLTDDDAALFEKSIEQGCERIDGNEW